ncbi:MAG: PilN domain-containing protein [Pseudomonadota bacterium]
MILINLLPHREAARKRRRDLFNVALVVSALAGLLISGVVYLWYEAQIANQQGKNGLLIAENKRMDVIIKEVANLQNEIAALKARQKAVEDLQANRNSPVHLLNELARLLPDGVYINSMRQSNNQITVTGVAQSNERVSELLRNIAGDSNWLTRPELVEIVAANLALNARDTRRVGNFTMRMALRTSEDVEKAAAAASAPR